MPLTANDAALWDAFKQKQYNEIIELIKSNPEEDLVNSVDINGSSLLLKLFYKKPLPFELLTFMAGRPQLNLQCRSLETKETNVEVILSQPTGLPRVFALFEKNPQIIMDGSVPSYVTLKEMLNRASKTYDAKFKKNPNTPAAKKKEQQIDDFKLVLTKLRDITIHRAIDTGNIDILLKMQKAGDNLSSPLSDGTNPAFLAAHNPIIAPFFSVRPAVAVVVAKSSPVRASQSPHAAFFNGYGYANVHAHPAAEHKQEFNKQEFKAPRSLAEAQARLEQLKIDRLKARGAFHNESINQGLEFIDQAIIALRQ